MTNNDIDYKLHLRNDILQFLDDSSIIQTYCNTINHDTSFNNFARSCLNECLILLEGTPHFSSGCDESSRIYNFFHIIAHGLSLADDINKSLQVTDKIASVFIGDTANFPQLMKIVEKTQESRECVVPISIDSLVVMLQDIHLCLKNIDVDSFISLFVKFSNLGIAGKYNISSVLALKNTISFIHKKWLKLSGMPG